MPSGARADITAFPHVDSFEGTWSTDASGHQLPPGWTIVNGSTAQTATQDLTQKLDGTSSWKLKSTDTTSAQVALSDYIAVTPSNQYFIAIWVKPEVGTEQVLVGVQEYDGTKTAISPPIVSYVITPGKNLPRQWIRYSGVASIRSSATRFIRVRLLGPYKSIGSVRWEAMTITPASTQLHLPPSGAINSATASSVKFGATNVLGSGVSIVDSSVLSDGKQDTNGTKYRELLPQKTLILKIPAFNADSDGLPRTPLLLEIRYKDTIDESLYNDPSNRRAAYIQTQADFVSDSPLVPTDKQILTVASLGGRGNGSWYTMQHALNTAPFQSLHAVGGFYTLRIRMPNVVSADAQATLPIDYIALREITPAQLDSYLNHERWVEGHYASTLPKDEPSTAVQYPDSSLVAFQRDTMQPIYAATKPKASELLTGDAPVSAVSAPGEIEPLSIGLYSQNGLQNLTFSVTDLLGEAGSTISQTGIEVKQVVAADRRINFYYDPRFARIPDRLESLSALSIPSGESRQIWLKVHVPSNTAPGAYDGTLNIAQQGTLRLSVPLHIDIIKTALDHSAQLNPVYHDPFQKTFARKLDDVVNFQAELGTDIFFYDRDITPILDSSGQNIARFDTSLLQQKLTKLKSAGLLRAQAILEPNSWRAICTKLKTCSVAAGSPNFWAELSTPEFVSAFGLYIDTVSALGRSLGTDFIFSVIDEPGTDPFRRIVADRLFTIIKAHGGKTTATYYLSADAPLTQLGVYQVPNNSIPGLSSLVDYPVWTPFDQGIAKQNDISAGVSSKHKHYGYYTTYSSHLRNPIYNRFLHGILAGATGAEVVSSYAMGDIINNPFDDFDRNPRMTGKRPDFILAYPSWNDGLIPTMGAEGLREGIKDAKFVATLKRLIAEQPTAPAAIAAKAFLDKTFQAIAPDFVRDYAYSSQRTDGFYDAILADVSENGSGQDFAAFTTFRKKVADYINQLAKSPSPRPSPTPRPSFSPTPAPSKTPTPVPSASPIVSPTPLPSPPSSPTPVPSASPRPTASPTPISTATPFRTPTPQPAGDTDGDGVSDSQERADGSDPADAGSYRTQLLSPVYALWNGFLGMTNILELVNIGDTEAFVHVTLFRLDGSAGQTVTIPLPPGGQFDLVLNDLEGFTRDSYGLVKIEFEGKIDGRMSYYRASVQAGVFDFGFHIALANASHGMSAVAFNTFGADGQTSASNWLSVVNLSPSAQDFTIRKFDQSGELLQKYTFSLESLARRDVEAGHETPGPNRVGLMTITPENPSTIYLAHLCRYGIDEQANFRFALALRAAHPTGQPVFAILSPERTSQSWAEIINAGATTDSVLFVVHGPNGATRTTEELSLAPHSQVHADLNKYLAPGESGFVEVRPFNAESTVVQVLTYLRTASGRLATVYPVVAVEALGGRLLGSYNMFLAMQNSLRLSNTAASATTISVDVGAFLGATKAELWSSTLAPFETVVLDLSSILKAQPDTYGGITVRFSPEHSVVSDILRRKSNGTQPEWVMPSPMR